MEATLTKSELDAISTMVSDKLHARFIADGSQKELQTAAENYTREMIGYYLKDNSISYEVASMIKPILDQHLKESNVIDNQLRKFMDTEHFKRLEIEHLRHRINKLQRDLDEERNDD